MTTIRKKRGPRGEHSSPYPGATRWNDRRRQWGRVAGGRTINNRTLLPRRK